MELKRLQARLTRMAGNDMKLWVDIYGVVHARFWLGAVLGIELHVTGDTIEGVLEAVETRIAELERD